MTAIYILLKHSIAGWSSSEARRAHNPKVTGSNPVPATRCGGVAQLARAFGSYPDGQRFESTRRYHIQGTQFVCTAFFVFIRCMALSFVL